MSSLLERFCRYVRVDTTAVEETEQAPSSPGQLELGRMLAEELTNLGLSEVSVDEFGIVMGTVPGNEPGAPTIAWLAHLDTSPEASGSGVQPTVHHDYDGTDIVLKGSVIRVDEVEELASLAGKTLITSDGTTLLGADDKAGVAAIVTAAELLIGDPSLKHGPIRVVFTVDEEIARGTDHVDVSRIDATCAYTVDAAGQGEIEDETFSADLCTVVVRGRNVHPGLAKDKMVNAVRAAADFVAKLPRDMAPETTSGKEAFLHVCSIVGDVSEVKMRILLRSFVTSDLKIQARLLRGAAEAVMADHTGARIEIEISEQYRNMADGLRREPRATELAAQAFRNIGIEPTFSALRGGTDGARLTEMGLPTPNLSAGMHNYHSPREFACLEEMQTTVRMLVELATLWGAERQ